MPLAICCREHSTMYAVENEMFLLDSRYIIVSYFNFFQFLVISFMTSLVIHNNSCNLKCYAYFGSCCFIHNIILPDTVFAWMTYIVDIAIIL